MSADPVVSVGVGPITLATLTDEELHFFDNNPAGVLALLRVLVQFHYGKWSKEDTTVREQVERLARMDALRVEGLKQIMIANPGQVIVTRISDGKRYYLDVRTRWSADPFEAWPWQPEQAERHMRRLFNSVAWRTHDDINIIVPIAERERKNV